MPATLRMAILACAASQAFCQGFPSQTALGGFQLGQVARVTDAKFGRPHVTRTTEDDWLVKAYWTSDQHDRLLIFEFAPPGKDRITSIQVFGKPVPGPPGLGPITLGSTEAEVLRAFGPPSARKTYEDQGVQYTKLEFGGRNYSVELDDQGRVVSTKLFGNEGFPDLPKDLPTCAALLQTLDPGQPGNLAALLAPDFEFYRDGAIIRYEGPALEDIETHAALREALFGPKGLRAALAAKDAEPDPQVRITGGRRVFHVLKFPRSRLLKEIVFTFQGGAWRIHEVAFRP